MKVTIIGYGRFGKTLHKLLRGEFEILIYDKQKVSSEDTNSKVCTSLEEATKSDVIFLCVPINQFESVLNELLPYISEKQLLIDVLSVKSFPADVITKSKKNLKCILTHPMFGPDSSKNGFKDLPIVMDQFTAPSQDYSFWKSFFKSKGLTIIELSPQKHDELAANSQGVAHFIGRTLEKFGYSPTVIDTLGAKKLYEIKEQTCNDSFELFHDLQTYNPLTKQMRLNLGTALDEVYSQLLPTQVSKDYVTYGIQGGKGSFNEQALLKHLAGDVSNCSINYLFTTKNVLQNLHEGNIDIGVFAISNTLGGIVSETIEVLGTYKFKIIDQVTINIQHFLMKRKDVDASQIREIIAHPQVFKQCANTLKTNYAHLQQTVGDGELIDTANAAKALAEGRLNSTTAILGPKGLAELYAFDIMAANLQDNDDNRTTFLIVKRL